MKMMLTTLILVFSTMAFAQSKEAGLIMAWRNGSKLTQPQIVEKLNLNESLNINVRTLRSMVQSSEMKTKIKEISKVLGKKNIYFVVMNEGKDFEHYSVHLVYGGASVKNASKDTEKLACLFYTVIPRRKGSFADQINAGLADALSVATAAGSNDSVAKDFNH